MNHAAVEKRFRQLLDINDLLANLDITVGFLVSVGGDPNASLVQFMTDTLKMKTRRQPLTDAVSVASIFLVLCLHCILDSVFIILLQYLSP